MSEQRTANGMIVQKVAIIGTSIRDYSAWELTSPVGASMFGHSNITTIDGAWYGRVGTRRLTAELDALPAYTSERSAAVQCFHAAQYAEAYCAIVAAFPETKDGSRSSGVITMQEG